MFKCENCGAVNCQERYEVQFCEDCKKYPVCKLICVCPAGELVNYDEHCFEPKEETVESKERQIEEIKQVVGLNCDRQGFAKHCPERISSGIYTAGYRRADEVIDEFVDKIKAKIEGYSYENTEGVDYIAASKEELIDMINELADELKSAEIKDGY